MPISENIQIFTQRFLPASLTFGAVSSTLTAWAASYSVSAAGVPPEFFVLSSLIPLSMGGVVSRIAMPAPLTCPMKHEELKTLFLGSVVSTASYGLGVGLNYAAKSFTANIPTQIMFGPAVVIGAAATVAVVSASRYGFFGCSKKQNERISLGDVENESSEEQETTFCDRFLSLFHR